MSGGPLSGLRVVEFGQLLAGPYVGTLLGDFGAEVIKVEPPPAGDAMRDWGRLRHNDRVAVVDGARAQQALDHAQPAHRGGAGDRAGSSPRDADVVLENFRPGTMEKLVPRARRRARVQPAAVYARVSGYGQTGRYRDRPGFASAGEAVAGLRHINGYPGQAPPRNGISLGDTLAAQSAFQGILLALYARDARGGERAGRRRLDHRRVLRGHRVRRARVREDRAACASRPARACRGIAPSNVYRSSDDRWVVIAANHDTLWRRLAELMGRPELGEDERFATHNARGENEDQLDELIGEWAAQHTAEELDRIVNDAGVVCARVYSAADVYEDPYFRERELLVEHEDEVHGTVTVPGIVPKLSAHARGDPPAGALDGGRRHRRRARRARGSTADDIADLRERRDRVIVCDVGAARRPAERRRSRSPRPCAPSCATAWRRPGCRAWRRSASCTRSACRRWRAPRRCSRPLDRRDGVVHAALVLNERGLERAIDAGVRGGPRRLSGDRHVLRAQPEHDDRAGARRRARRSSRAPTRPACGRP